MTKIKHKSNADKLVQKILSDGYELYVDMQNRPFIVRPDSPHIARQIRSQDLRGYLAKIHWDEFAKSVQGYTLEATINTLEGLAIADGERVEVFNRVARLGNTIYYDIGDDKHIVKINRDGWEVITSVPVIFRRYKHQLPQTLPKSGGSLLEIADHLNISNEMQEILLTTYLPVALIPNIPRQLLLIHGPQGAGKSTALTLIRSLIDPSTVPLLTPTSKTDEIVREADHNFCFYLDNISNIDGRMSDALCRLVTGLAFTKRELYTNDEDVIYSFKRAVAVNGVAQCATKPDLLDRSLIIQLERIGEDERELDSDLQARFSEAKPKLLGALFDAVAGTLATLDKVDKQSYKLPRMADYYLYSLAAAEHLGFGADKFAEAYAQNVNEQNQESLNSSLVGMLILEFMSMQGDEWKGSGSDLYSSLVELADDQRSTPGFPRDHMWLWRKIQEIKTTLEAVGIVALRNTSVRPRGIILRKTSNFLPMPEDQLHCSPLDGGNGGTTQASTASMVTGSSKPTLIELYEVHNGKSIEASQG